jgi:hypothetical protein
MVLLIELKVKVLEDVKEISRGLGFWVPSRDMDSNPTRIYLNMCRRPKGRDAESNWASIYLASGKHSSGYCSRYGISK